eukprot:GEZU01011982.1.p1 GENE.GEZU01011982.1~~GEZU01011982.1.p1  ORF type:complete len:686 (+),score=165.48 GEZU01011982.1:75-2132(+)
MLRNLRSVLRSAHSVSTPNSKRQLVNAIGAAANPRLHATLFNNNLLTNTILSRHYANEGGSAEAEAVTGPQKPNDIIGIDFGTTNTCVAIFEAQGAKVLENAEGARVTPSFVAYKEDGEQLIGSTAKRQAITNPKNTVFATKRIIGRKFADPAVQEWIKKAPYTIVEDENGDAVIELGIGKKETPSQIASAILAKMKEIAESHLGRKVTKAVVTVPAYFTDAQKAATKEAGKLAGLNIPRMITEPVAAALGYALDKSEAKNRKIFFYHMGGGTFDVAILELNGGVLEVKATGGDPYLGGDNFDEELMSYLQFTFKRKEKMNLTDPSSLQRLREAVEKAKIELTNSLQSEINLPFITADETGPKHLIETVSRSRFESLVDGLIMRTLEPCQKVLADANVKLEEITDVILSGGMTRMPRVQDNVKRFFNKEPLKSINPDEIIAMGAAIQASVLVGEAEKVILLDITPLSLGIEHYDGSFLRMIPKGVKMPFKKRILLSNIVNNQTKATINVYIGERELASANKLLTQLQFPQLFPMPRGASKIEFTMEIEKSGKINLTARNHSNNKQLYLTLDKFGGLTGDEIEAMLEDAKASVEADRKQLDYIRSKISAKSTIAQANTLVQELPPRQAALFAFEVSVVEKEKLAMQEVLAQENSKLEEILAAEERLKKAMAELTRNVDMIFGQYNL